MPVKKNRPMRKVVSVTHLMSGSWDDLECGHRVPHARSGNEVKGDYLRFCRECPRV